MTAIEIPTTLIALLATIGFLAYVIVGSVVTAVLWNVVAGLCLPDKKGREEGGSTG